MSANAPPLSGAGATWNVLFLIGILCAVPNLLFMLFVGGWSSVPEHRAVPDGQPLPVIGPLEVALNHIPAMVVLGLTIAAIGLRMNGRAKLAGLLSMLQIFAGVPLIVFLI